jgi:hypothetical protein
VLTGPISEKHAPAGGVFRSCAWWQVKHNRANDGSGSRLRIVRDNRQYLRILKSVSHRNRSNLPQKCIRGHEDLILVQQMVSVAGDISIA